ncbi:hypothetical protein NCC49_002038 [Naganishia albida]|nr:hypothetical protein NCC49_002038 [Naganishia albida]
MAFPNIPSNYSVPTTLSNLTTSGPELCGIPLNGPLKKTEVTPNEFVTVYFSQESDTLRAPFRVYGVQNYGEPRPTGKETRMLQWLEFDRFVKCMRPFDVVGEGIGFVWQVINRNFTSKENGTVGVNVGDFVWFHGVPLGETDDGQGVRFWTSDNYTVVDVKTSGGVPAVAAKSGLIILAGGAMGTLLSLAC